MAFDSQRGSTSTRMTHRLSLGHITDYWGRPVMRRRRQHSDTGSFKPLFLLCGPTPEEKIWKKKRRYVTGEKLLKSVLHNERGGFGTRANQGHVRITAALSTRSSYDVLRRHLESITPWKGRCFARSRHACDGEGNGFDHDRFSLRPLRKRGKCVTNTRKAVCSAHDDSRGWYWAAYKCETWGCNQRIRQRLRGTERATFRHPGALHVSLPAIRGYKPGNRDTYLRQPLCCQRIRHWSRGTAQATFRYFGALHASLPANRGYTLGNRFASSLSSFAYTSEPGTTYWVLGHCWQVGFFQMVTLGAHDQLLRAQTLIPGVVTFRPQDFEIDVTKEERLASFFVRENMATAPNSVALYGPFYGDSDQLVDANRLKAQAMQNHIEFYLLVNVGVEVGPAETALKRLGALKERLVTATQDINSSDGRSCKVGATSLDFQCITVDKEGAMASKGLSLAVFRLKLSEKTYLTCDLVQQSFRVLQQSGQSLLPCDGTVLTTWPSHNTAAGNNHLQRLLVPSTRAGQMVPHHVLRSEDQVNAVRERLAAPLQRQGLTVDKVMVLYKDVLSGQRVGCTAFVFDPTVVAYLLLVDPGLGSIGQLLFAYQLKLIRPLILKAPMAVDDAEEASELIKDLTWPTLSESNPFANMQVDLRHPLAGTPLLAQHLLDVLPFSLVFQANTERVGPPPVISIQHFVSGEVNADVVIGYVASQIIAALSEHLHWSHEQLTIDYWGPRVGVQHVWFKSTNTICRILIVVESGRQHQLIVDKFHGTFFPWDRKQSQAAYISNGDCSCIGCQTRRKREHGFGCVDCGSTGHLARDVGCPHFQERLKQNDLKRAARREREGAEAGASSTSPGTAGITESVGAVESAGRTSQESSTRPASSTLPTATPLPEGSSSGSAGRGNMNGSRGSGNGGAFGRGKGGKGATRVEYNWLCGFCHKPNGSSQHNSKYCAKPFILPPLSELPKSACLFCNHDHFFMRCPILSENGTYILPNAYVTMARALNYPVKEVQGRVVLNLAASLPKLEEAPAAGTGSGVSRSPSQASSERDSVGSEIVLTGGEDQSAMQLQVQQALSHLGDKLMAEMGRQLAERFGELTAGMSELSKSHNTLQERVTQQATLTTSMIETMQQQVQEYRAEAKEAQEKGDRQLQEAMKKMAAVAQSMSRSKSKGAGGAGVKDLASTSAMES